MGFRTETQVEGLLSFRALLREVLPQGQFLWIDGFQPLNSWIRIQPVGWCLVYLCSPGICVTLVIFPNAKRRQQ